MSRVHVEYVYKQRKNQTRLTTGEIYKDTYGYGTIPYVGDIGHAMIDTLQEARNDIISIWNEHY